LLNHSHRKLKITGAEKFFAGNAEIENKPLLDRNAVRGFLLNGQVFRQRREPNKYNAFLKDRVRRNAGIF